MTTHRTHVTLPVGLKAEVREQANRHGFKYSSMLERVIKAGLEHWRRVDLTQPTPAPSTALAPVPAPSPAPAAADTPPPPPLPEFEGDFNIKHIHRGDAIWFALTEVCAVLGIKDTALTREIDPDDDVLSYAGDNWIDARGLQVACGLAKDFDTSTRLSDWANTLENRQ